MITYSNKHCHCVTDGTWDPSYTPEQIEKFKKQFYNPNHKCEFVLKTTLDENNKEYHCCGCNRRLRILDGKEFINELYPKIKNRINLRRR